LFFFSNVLIYSIPVYLIAGIMAKFRKKKIEPQDPPAPPVLMMKLKALAASELSGDFS
jgi:hypothetical protein